MSIKNNLIPPSPQINPQSLRPFTRFCCTIGNLPSSYLASMTYEEQLLWLCNYLENTVIPTINNNSEALQEVQDLFVELKNYVDNYFNNLDVQEEINNKLDEMAEDGTLDTIIEAFINANALWCFNNVNELKESTNLINGSFAKTLNFYDTNDIGGSIYKISNDENLIANDINIIELSNGLKAILQVKNKYNIDQLGCKGDNETINTTKLKYIFEEFAKDGDTIIIPVGKYLIDNKIECEKIVNVKGLKSIPFRSETERNGSVIKNIGVSGFIFNTSISLENVDFIGNGLNSNCFGVNILQGNIKVRNCSFGYFNQNIGLYLGNELEYLNLNDYFIEKVTCYQCDIGCKISNPLNGSLTTPNANAGTVIGLTCQSSRIGLYLENGTMNNFLSLHLENNTEYGMYLKNMYYNLFLHPYLENGSHNIYFDENSNNNIVLGTNRPVNFSSLEGNTENNFILSNLSSKGIRNIFNKLYTQTLRIGKEDVTGYWDFIHENTRQLHLLFAGSSNDSNINLCGDDYKQNVKMDSLKINKDSNTKFTNMSTRLATLSSKTIPAHSVSTSNFNFDAIANDNSNLKYWNTNISFENEIDDDLIVTTHPSSIGIKVKFYNTSDNDITLTNINYCLFAFKQYS